MNEEFVKDIRKALKLARLNRYRELAGLRRLTSLKILENRMLSSPDRSPVYLGNNLKSLLWEAIDAQQPSFPEDLNTQPWRIYILLRDFYKRGERWRTVADRIGVERATFQELKRLAGEEIAATIWEWEEETRLAVVVKDNLPPQSFIFAQYIERYNRFEDKPIIPGYKKEDKLAEIIIEMLRGKPWIITLNGPPGVGKTALAYEVGRRCKERRLFEAIIWASAKKKVLVVRAEQVPSFAQVPYIKTVTSCEGVLDTIAHILEYRAVSGPNGFNRKLEIVNDLLKNRNCLIIIDNLEEFDPDALDQLRIFLRQYKGPSKVLLTSRRIFNIGDQIVDISGLSFDEASELMDQVCTLQSLDILTEEEKRDLYKATKGNPLAINLTLRLMKSTEFPLKEAIKKFVKDKVVLDFMWGEAYKRLGREAKQVLHVMPIFVPFSASIEAITAASQLDSSQALHGLGTLCNFNFVTRSDSRFMLRSTSAHEFLKKQKGPIDGISLSEFTAKAYVGLANYYIQALKERPTIDQKLRFLREGRGDEKWNVLATLQGCRALADANFECEGCRPYEAWRYIIDLFDLIGQSLGILRYLDERLRWGKEACVACQALGEERKKAWFEVFDIGWTYLVLGEERKAEELFTKQLEFAKKMGYPEVQALALYNMGRMARERGELDKASKLFIQSSELWLECERKQWIAYTKSSLGLVKYRQAQLLKGKDRQNKLLEARTILEESLELRRELGYLDDIVEGLSETALVYAALGIWREAWQRSDQSLQLAQEISPPSSAYAYALKLRAEIEEHLGRIDEAKEYARKALNVYKAAGAKYMYSITESYYRHLEEKQQQGENKS